MSLSQTRKPKGVPVGGQFSATARAEAGVALSYEDNLQSFADEVAGRDAYDEAVTRALSAAKAYETTDQLEMEDPEFDRLLEQIKTYEDRFGLTPDHDLHSSVGHGGAVGGDIEHATPMLSLDKPGEDAVIEFAEAHPNAVLEPKIDGLAISARYENGKLVRAARRGDGYTGEDVTERVRGVDGLPESSGEGDFEVRGELYLSDKNLASANEVRSKAGKAPFKNARNGVAGMLNKQDGSYAGLFSFAAYSTTFAEEKNHLDQMNAISDLGFTTAHSLLPDSVLEAEDPMAAIAALGSERKGIGFLMDGAVLKVPTNAEKSALGEGSRAPKWAVAYKYPAVEEPTVIRDIELNIGKTGRLSMRAVFDKVSVDGSDLEYASLHNVGWLERADMRIGDEVMAYKANDIIPQVHLPRADKRSDDSRRWTPPSECPQCHEPFDKSTELWRCKTPGCSVSGRISYAVSRDAGLDIEGFGGSVGDLLIEEDLVQDVGDVFHLTQAQIAGLQTGVSTAEQTKGDPIFYGEARAKKIMAEIEKAKTQPLNRVITSLSMRFTGRTFGRRLAAQFETMDALQGASVSQLSNIEGIGDKKALVIHDELKKSSPVIAKLRAAGVNMGAPKEKSTGSQALAGMNVVVTGSMKGSPLGSLSRGQVQELIETHGGRAAGSVSKSTSLLVCGEPGSSKHTKAGELGVNIVTPTEFASMLGM